MSLKDKLTRLKQHPKYDVLLNWGKLISVTGGTQIIVQAVGFASGILIIRILPVHEYAFYTLANIMLGTMTMLADGGISKSVLSQGGKVWQDKEKLGAVFATGMHLRYKFAIGSLIVSIPILVYLLIQNEASWLTIVLIVLSVIPAFFASLSDSLLEIIPKLHQDIVPLQKNQIQVGIWRLILTGLTIFIFPWAFVAILGSGIPRIIGNVSLRKIAHNFIDSKQRPDLEIQKNMIILVRRFLPNLIYYLLYSQFSIWIITFFGETESIAHVGAIGRLTLLLGLVAIMFDTLLIPRFARLEEQYDKLITNATKILTVSLLINVVLFLLFYLFSDYLLAILGNNYKGLKFEFILLLLNSCLTLTMGVALSLYLSRGWVLRTIVGIGFSLIPIFIGCMFLDLTKLSGVILLNILTTVVELFLQIGFLYYNIFKLKKH